MSELAHRFDDNATSGVGDDAAWNQFSSDAVVSTVIHVNASASRATARWFLKKSC